MAADVPAERRLRLVRLAALGAAERLVGRVAQQVGLQVVLAAAGVRAVRTAVRTHALVHPHVLAQVGVGARERLLAVRALVALATCHGGGVRKTVDI